MRTHFAHAILSRMSCRAYEHIYLSPHLDDAVLSCGGTIHTQAHAGDRILVVTFFAGSPPDDSLTLFALELKQRWQSEGDPGAARRQEDRQATRTLGADALSLGFLDCVYRQSAQGEVQKQSRPKPEVLYPTEESIFGEVHSLESGWDAVLLEALQQRLGVLDGSRIYAPLAAGHHVDHLLIRRVGIRLLGLGARVWFYEDYPYSDDGTTIRAAKSPWPESCWRSRQIALDRPALAAKGDAVACYRSQISTFWSSLEEMRRALVASAQVDGTPSYVESLWELSTDCL